MRKPVVAVAVLLALVLVLCVSGCSRYNSHFRALLLITSDTSDSGYMKFSNFTGTKVFKFNCRKGALGDLEYSGFLEGGKATVYYDDGGEKTELFTLEGGQSEVNATAKVNPGTVYVIVETDGTCEEGKFSFKLR